jgi:pimeloyl-ACP methyl ester carboxylesterase
MSSRTIETRTVGTGEDAITYDVHGDLADATPDRPVLMMMGSPMDAVGFTSLAARFTDRPVVTYDPRGAGRNPTGTSTVTPEQHGEDIFHVIEALDAGPVDLLGSSGGAVNALAMVQAHPDAVRHLVAHEPPTAALLPDREQALAVCRDIRETYERSGRGPAMAKFIAFVMHSGEVPADYLDRPAPDPAQFGMSADDDGTRTDPLMRNMPPCNDFEPDVESLRALGDRLVVAVGAESHDELAARGARSVAEAVGVPVAVFPGGHGGFLGGEYGQQGDPDGFAAALRSVLD